MASHPKHINHELSPMKCPVALDDVDLFGQGAQERWYEAYKILHREAPVLRIEGGGYKPLPRDRADTCDKGSFRTAERHASGRRLFRTRVGARSALQ